MDTAITDLRTDLIGINAVFPQKQMPLQEPQEVRLRIAGRTQDRSTAQKIANEVEALYTNGPYGGGGATKKVEEVISVASILVPKAQVDKQVRYLFQDVK